MAKRLRDRLATIEKLVLPTPGASSVSKDGMGLFGDSSDGTIVLDGTVSPSWATKSGSTYTLLREVHAINFTIRPGVTVVVAGCRIFCSDTFTNEGILQQDGLDAIGTIQNQPGTGGIGVVSTGTSQNNPSTGDGTGGQLPTAGGGRGGIGGDGSGHPGGAQGAAPSALAITAWRAPFPTPNGKGGGGSNGGGDNTNKGGQGGNGGGAVVVFARHVINNGLISSKGGRGQNGPAGNTGGGGGGGGGIVVLYSIESATGSGTVNVAGGAAGSGIGTGTAGATGAAGGFLNVVLS